MKAVVDAKAKKDVPLTEFTAAVTAIVTTAAVLAVPEARARLQLGKSAGTELVSAVPGAATKLLRVRVVDPKINDADLPTAFTAMNPSLKGEDIFNLEVFDGGTGARETHRNVTMKESPRRLKEVLAAESRLVRYEGNSEIAPVPNDPDPLTDDLKPIVPFGKDDQKESKRSTGVNNAPSDGDHLDEATIIGSEDGRTGIYALEKLYADGGLFNLLCIPPFAPESSETATKMVNVVTAAAKYCEDHRAMLLIDPPESFNAPDFDKAKTACKAGMADPDGKIGTKSNNAAIFFPRLRQPDPLRDGQMGSFAPCGAVAGIMARTDGERGVWKAPAGLSAGLVGVPKLEHRLTDAENGELNPLGLNCLRTFPVIGNVVWGSRTMEGADQRASEWKYIPIRRTALYIEESLYRGTQWVVFEPNDEPLWGQIRLNVGAFMHGLFRQGAFQGASPQDAYFVRCDKDTNPQIRIDQGIVTIMVGFAPLKPAEFVVIQLQQMAGQIAS